MLRTEAKAHEKHEEYQALLQIKDDITRDEIERQIDLKMKKEEFKSDMEHLKQQKLQKQQLEDGMKMKETYDYFPFTHGEKIESMQEEYRNIVKESKLSKPNSTIASNV